MNVTIRQESPRELRFGYKPAYTFDTHFSFELPKVNSTAIELSDGALKAIQATVRYPEAFGIL